MWPSIARQFLVSSSSPHSNVVCLVIRTGGAFTFARALDATTHDDSDVVDHDRNPQPVINVTEVSLVG
jgi:hypothetical protein